jgi:hypothetical protein
VRLTSSQREPPRCRDEFLEGYLSAEQSPLLNKAGRCKLNGIETRVQSAWCQRLKLKCEKLLSSFALEFKWWRYSAGRFLDVVKGPAQMANVEAEKDMHILAQHSSMANSAQNGSMGAGGVGLGGAGGSVVRNVTPAGQGLALIVYLIHLTLSVGCGTESKLFDQPERINTIQKTLCIGYTFGAVMLLGNHSTPTHRDMSLPH